MSDLERYSVINQGMRREFILLQGTGCRWKRCAFCDYHLDTSSDPYAVNRPVLESVTGEYGVLDVINSGSAPELDGRTIEHIKAIVKERGIHDLWFEAHWMYRNVLPRLASLFPCRVHFRTGVESFDPAIREAWNKGIPEDVTPEMIREHFEGVCLLAGIKGQTRESIMKDAKIADRLFSYYSVNLFTPNTTATERDEALCRIFVEELAPIIRKSPKAEVLVENTDLGVG